MVDSHAGAGDFEHAELVQEGRFGSLWRRCLRSKVNCQLPIPSLTPLRSALYSRL